MIKFIRKKILESVVKDIIANLPKYKDLAKLQFEEHKDAILSKVQTELKKIIKEIVTAHLD